MTLGDKVLPMQHPHHLSSVMVAAPSKRRGMKGTRGSTAREQTSENPPLLVGALTNCVRRVCLFSFFPPPRAGWSRRGGSRDIGMRLGAAKCWLQPVPDPLCHPLSGCCRKTIPNCAPRMMFPPQKGGFHPKEHLLKGAPPETSLPTQKPPHSAPKCDLTPKRAISPPKVITSVKNTPSKEWGDFFPQKSDFSPQNSEFTPKSSCSPRMVPLPTYFSLQK